jgi:hypothetical protein
MFHKKDFSMSAGREKLPLRWQIIAERVSSKLGKPISAKYCSSVWGGWMISSDIKRAIADVLLEYERSQKLKDNA